MNWRGLVRAPVLHFLLLGGLLFTAQRWIGVPDTVLISEVQVQQLREDWQRETGRMPSTPELQASLSRHVDEALLLQEALRLELDSKDAVARQRMLNNLRFALDDQISDDADLLAEARRLDMPVNDVVVRRRLLQVMENRLLTAELPTDVELRQYVSDRPQRYTQAARYSFSQRYFSRDGRGETAALAQAQAALTQLQAAPQSPVGENFLLGQNFSHATPEEITARFGKSFATAVTQAKSGQWVGPLLSPYGAHLIRIAEVQAPQPADYASIRARAAYAWLAEHEPQRLREVLAPLRARYRVELPYDVVAQGLRP